MRDFFGRPFSIRGQFRTIKCKEACAVIICPHCSFESYATHIPGSCTSLTCPSCYSQFMGVTDKVNCGECEQRVKCLGLQPIPYKCLTSEDAPRLTIDNSVLHTDVWEAIQASMTGAFLNGFKSRKR